MRGLAYNPGILPAEMIIRQHISSADYTEEGGAVCEFAAQPRKGGAA
ncbi:DUF2737 family protein [Salmonella enterica subsp. enterica serovar Braenderup]|nr:DUF2737 family protein [Salmonella enterica]